MRIFRFVSAFITFCLVLFAINGARASVVGDIEIQGLHVMEKDELLYLLGITPGDPIDEPRVREGIKRAFLKGIFDDISVEATDGEEKKVIIRVKQKAFIKEITATGDYAIPRKTILSLFPLKENQYLSCDMLEKAVEILRREAALRGYPNASIEASVEAISRPNQIAVRLRVDTGRPERVERLVVRGMTDEAKAVMELSEGDVFNRNLLQDDIDRMEKYYKSLQYIRPVIKPYIYEDGVLTLSVLPGKRLAIVLDGNEVVSEKVILREMPFFEAEDFNDDLIEESIQRMISLYHASGYPFVQVAPVVTEKDDLITLTFFIFEGKRVRTGKISFEGTSLNEESLKNIISLQDGKIYNPDFIESDKETLGNFYYALGHLSARIEEFRTSYDESAQKTDIIITINEGTRTQLGTIEIVGMQAASEDHLRSIIRLKPGDPYNEVDISDARYRVIEFYTSNGFPSAEVSVTREFDAQRAHLIFSVTEGPFAVFGKTIVTGNNRTKYPVIKRELISEENAPFDYTILRREKQKLYKLGLFADIDVEMLEDHDYKRDVLISVHEANAGAVEFGFGFSDYELYRGFLDVSYRNLWGMHRQASVRTEASSLDRRFILQYYEPWFLNSITAFRTFFLAEHRKELNVDTRETRYRLSRYAVSAGVERKLSAAIKAELFYDFSVVNTYDVKPDVVLSREDTGSLVISGLRLGIIYDTRDDPFSPSAGILSGLYAKITSPLFFSESDFIKLSFYGNLYHELLPGLVIAASIRGGVAEGYGGTSELPIVERFFLGGRTTVRGYEQDTLGPKGSDGNPTGGNIFIMQNLEMRIAMGKGIGLVAFLDGGNVWPNIKDMAFSDGKFTAGLGCRYDTPVGPLRIDYGHKLRRERDESRGEIHFSIGHAF